MSEKRRGATDEENGIGLRRVSTTAFHSTTSKSNDGPAGRRPPVRSMTLPPSSLGSPNIAEPPYVEPSETTDSADTFIISTNPSIEKSGDGRSTTIPTVAEVQRQSTTRSESIAFNENAGKVWEYERKSVERRKDRIDNLLVFAALFSAVLTAFVVDSYQLLQPQAADETNRILYQISQQLNSFTVSNGYINSTTPTLAKLPSDATSTSKEVVSGSAVLINALWFSSLVFSLTAASVGIAARQWLNHHDNVPLAVHARISVRIWHTRHIAFDDWHVGAILSTLPVLLQTALVLFLVGLVVKLKALNNVVADIIIAQAGLLGIFLIFTTLAPVFYDNCPYKSPQALWILQLRRLLSYSFTKCLWRCMHRPKPTSVSWIRNWGTYEQQTLKMNWQDLDSIAAADAVVMDDAFLEEFVGPTLSDHAYPSASVEALIAILEHRADRVVHLAGGPEFIFYPRGERDSQPLITMARIAIDVFLKLRHDKLAKTRYLIPSCRHIEALLKAIPGQHIDIRRSLFNALLVLTEDFNLPDDVREEISSVFSSDISRLSSSGFIDADFANDMGQRLLDAFIRAYERKSVDKGINSEEVLIRICEHLQQTLQITPTQRPDAYVRFFSIVATRTFPPRLLYRMARYVFLQSDLVAKFSPFVTRTDVDVLVQKAQSWLYKLEQDDPISQRADRDSSFLFACSDLSVLLGAAPTSQFGLYHRLFRVYLRANRDFSPKAREMAMQLLGNAVNVYVGKGDSPIAAMAEITTDMLVESCDLTRRHVDRIQLLSTRESLIALLRHMPTTRSEIYCRLLSVLPRGTVLEEARGDIIGLVHEFSRSFCIGSADYKNFVKHIASTVSNDTCLALLCASAVNLCIHMPELDLSQARQSVQGQLVPAIERIARYGAWRDLGIVIGACAQLPLAREIFTGAAFDSWDEIISKRAASGDSPAGNLTVLTDWQNLRQRTGCPNSNDTLTSGRVDHEGSHSSHSRLSHLPTHCKRSVVLSVRCWLKIPLQISDRIKRTSPIFSQIVRSWQTRYEVIVYKYISGKGIVICTLLEDKATKWVVVGMNATELSYPMSDCLCFLIQIW